MTKAYKYEFQNDIDLRDIQDTLLLATLAAEALFGEAFVRMETSYSQDREARTLTVDAATSVGQVVNTIFTTYAI